MKKILVMALLSTPLMAQTELSSFEQRLQALEKSAHKSSRAPKIKGSIQLDTAFYQEDKDVPEVDRIVLEDGMNFRRVRLAAEGKFNDNFSYLSQFDMAENDFEIADLWMALNYGTHMIRLGDMKPSATQEEVMSSSHVAFLERGLGTNAFYYGRLTGLDFSGHFHKRVTYQAGVYTNGLSGRAAAEKSLFAYGAKLVGVVWQQEENLVHVGAHYMKGSQFEDTRFRTRAVTRVSSNPVFDTGVIANTHQSELMGAELVTLLGSFRGVYETAQAKATPRDFAGSDSYKFDSHQVTLGYILTGERRSYSSKSASIGKFSPDKEFLNGGWGAFELLGRYSTLDLNDSANSVEIKGGEGEAISLGLLWVMSPGVQMMFDYSTTDLKNSANHVNQKINVAQVRMEMKF